MTKLLKCKYPIMSAGMSHCAGAELVSAVSNAGGVGTLGAMLLSPQGLRNEIQRTKSMLLPGPSIAGTVTFGVNLPLPDVSGKATSRKTNTKYHLGTLEEVV